MSSLTWIIAAEPITRPHLGLAVVAAGAAFLGLLMLIGFSVANRPRRPPAGPTTQELGDEPPAVVDLLAGGFEPDDDAISATLVDLAARKHVDIDEMGERVFIRAREHRPDEPLAPYETRVMTHVQSLMGPDRSLPAEALTTGRRGISERWRRSFAREVIADAQDRGLCVDKWGSRDRAFLYAAAGAVVVLLWLSAQLGDEVDQLTTANAAGTVVWGVAVLGFIAIVAAIAKISTGLAQRDTEEGYEAARRWLGVREWYEAGNFAAMPAASVAVWDRHLAYATAMGTAPLVDRQLCFEAEHDKKAWSRYGGQYRPVKIRYWSLRPGWGEAPWTAMIKGVLYTLFFGSAAQGPFLVLGELTDAEFYDGGIGRWVMWIGTGLAVLLAPLILWNVARVVLGFASLFQRTTVVGEVVRARRRYGSGPFSTDAGTRTDTDKRPSHHVAIDDGTSDTITSYRVRQAVYPLAPQGAVVRATVRPLTGYVSEITLVPSAAPAFEATTGG